MSRSTPASTPRLATRAALILLVAVALGMTFNASIAKGAPATTKTTATWYGPGFYGNAFSCSRRADVPDHYDEKTTRGLAHMWLPCGTQLVICHGDRHGVRRCVIAMVIDTGAFDPDHLDLTARTARDLIGCRNCRPYTIRVSWRKR